MMHNDPSNQQLPKQIEQYYRSAKIGDVAVIRETYGGSLRLKITRIDGVNRKLGRVYLADASDFGGAAFYMKSGKSCYNPNGQARLVIPTESVLAWVAKQGT